LCCKGNEKNKEWKKKSKKIMKRINEDEYEKRMRMKWKLGVRIIINIQI
jgi:hypothetical protein